jgi:hypothetical protein
LGTVYSESIVDPSRLAIRTTEKFSHPNYSSVYVVNDISLLKLPNAVNISSKKEFSFLGKGF